MDIPAILKGYPDSQAIYDKILAFVTTLGAVVVRDQRSQVGFYRDRPFAAVWRPGQHLAGRRPPLVLTVFLRRRLRSRRWKEVVEPRPGQFVHHLEINAPPEVDRQVCRWLRMAWEDARRGTMTHSG